jgi:heptosyltransferase-2
METLIIKLGATGDVVRTTTLLHALDGEIHWLTSDRNTVMLKGSEKIAELIPWADCDRLRGRRYDLIINLEDSPEVASLLNDLKYKDLFGAYLNGSDKMDYTESSSEWFDLSLISRFGKEKADQLKLENRKTYQEMLFHGIGYSFTGQTYYIPESEHTDLSGDIAIAPESGSVWPMKNWAYYDELKAKLENSGYLVNYLPIRRTLNEHISDVQKHKYLVSGDSLPMHIALGSRIKCLSIFICTSPWEIYDYGLQKKVVSPLLEKYFYKRDFDREAIESVTVDRVFNIVANHFDRKLRLGKQENLVGGVRERSKGYQLRG